MRNKHLLSRLYLRNAFNSLFKKSITILMVILLCSCSEKFHLSTKTSYQEYARKANVSQYEVLAVYQNNSLKDYIRPDDKITLRTNDKRVLKFKVKNVNDTTVAGSNIAVEYRNVEGLKVNRWAGPIIKEDDITPFIWILMGFVILI